MGERACERKTAEDGGMGVQMKLWLRKEVGMAVGLVAVVMAVLAPSALATGPLDISKTATGHQTREVTWTIDKSVTPATHDLQTGQSGTSTYTVTVTKSEGASSAWVDGQVCVDNVMLNATENLAIVDRVQASVGGGPYATIATANLDLSGNPVLDPGESECYSYSISFTPVDGAAYRNSAEVTITNNPTGTPGVPQGPRVFADFTLPEPTVNDTINVDDTNGMTWAFSDSGSVSYDKTFTCDQDAGEHVNTATIRETGQSASATVTVNCTNPPPPICTYTKGWYQNKNGAPTVIAVDGRTKTQAQAIFAATPGKPGGVTWGVENKPNNLLNLYQQLLAALNNLGGDANAHAGPAAVDTAIDAALAGTGGTGLNITTTLSESEIGSLTDVLSSFNEGRFAGYPHCG